MARTSVVLSSLAAVFWIVPGVRADIPNPFPTPIPHGPVTVELQTVASGLAAPNLAIGAGDGSGRLFILDQAGQVRLLKNGTLRNDPFLDLSTQLVSLNAPYDERGLLGLAFDPDFADPTSPGYRRVFTYSSEPLAGPADYTVPLNAGKTMNHQSVIASWLVDPNNPDRVDPASRHPILRIDQPQSNHNGGMLAFGPDRYLYIALGDGGGANDDGSGNDHNGHNPLVGNAQDNTRVLGKILRIDVNGTDSANGKYGIPSDNPFAQGGQVPEIYATGFRNPFRFSFNGHELLVADVGQNRVEEVDRVEKGKNYGWRYKEGDFKFINSDGTISNDLSGLPSDLIDPILQYDHDEGIAILGGFVYRGPAIPQLQGKYVFGDFSKSFQNPAGRLFYADLAAGEIHELIIGLDDRKLNLFGKGLGQDEAGELYVLGSTTLGPVGNTGVAIRIVAIPEPAAIALLGTALLLLARRRSARKMLATTLALPVAAMLGTLTNNASAALLPIGAAKDNTIFESPTGALSDGAGPHIYVGRSGANNDTLRRRGLLAFDLSTIPPGSLINSATLTLYLSRSSLSGPANIGLHRLLKDWGEGTSNSGSPGGAGAAAKLGDATWIHSFHSSQSWTHAGGDYSPTVSASRSVNSLGAYTFSGTQMLADVQSWVNSPNANFGWILIGDELAIQTAQRFDSRQNSILANRPKLAVDYTLIPEP